MYNGSDISVNSFSLESLSQPLSPHISGASPTGYYVGNVLWKQITKIGVERNEVKSQPWSSTWIHEPAVVPPKVCGYTPLHCVPYMDRRDQACQVIEQASTEDINSEDHNGNTPLMWACIEGREDLVQVLVEQGANVNMQNFEGETALYHAASMGFHTICCILLENGADANCVTLDGASPAHIAASEGFVTVLGCLARYGAFLGAQDEEGDSVLHYAVRSGKEKVVEFLVKECKVSVDVRNEDSETPYDLASCLDEQRMLEILSTNGGILAKEIPMNEGISIINSKDEREGRLWTFPICGTVV